MCSTTELRSDRASAGDDAKQDHDYGDQQEHMNETAHGRGSDQAEQPEKDEDDCDGVEHPARLCRTWLAVCAPPPKASKIIMRKLSIIIVAMCGLAGWTGLARADLFSSTGPVIAI